LKKKPNKKVFFLGITSDIGRCLAEMYLRDGYEVYGTCRDREAGKKFEQKTGVPVFYCDVGERKSIQEAMDKFLGFSSYWDIFISAVGTTEPLGDFFSCDFDEWEDSVRTNSSAQLRVLHTFYPLRNKKAVSSVVFFAGGGTNNAFPKFSAYCVSKIMLIKMCELLNDENEDLNVHIIGPGWVRTKIHDQVLNNPKGSGESYQKVKQFLRSGETGTPNESIYDCINWCIKQGREVTGGRNLSVVYDDWGDGGAGLADELRKNPDKFKLRRNGNAEGSKFK
jgi:NAD(P)-dependent dehydrogenase (short-subunit alcohol dehydrogenase family)